MNLSQLLIDYEFTEESGYGWLNGILNVLNDVLLPILLVLAAVGTIYAIYLGVMLAKAENAEKREEAKKRIINVIVAIVITAALIFLMYLFSNNLDWFVNDIANEAGGAEETEELIGLLRR